MSIHADHSVQRILIRKVAENLATDILTVADAQKGGIECTRAQMMLEDDQGREKNMGGRNKASLIRTIEYHLAEVLDLNQRDPNGR